MQHCIHSAWYSKDISFSDAPVSFMLTKPFIPNVEGKMHDTAFQNTGTALSGHEIPERKRNGTDVNTNSNIAVSRSHTKQPSVIAMKMQARR